MYHRLWHQTVSLCFFSVLVMGAIGQPVSTSTAQVCDIGPIAIPSPPSMVYVDSTYMCSARVKNFSGQSANACLVVCTIDTLVDTVEISTIDGFGTASVGFSEWTVPDTGLYIGSYPVTVFTQCATDTNALNDTLSKRVYIPSDTLILVSGTGRTSQTIRMSLLLVNPYHRLGGIDIGAFLNTPGLAAFDSADYSNCVISHWEWLASSSPSATTVYLDAIAEDGSLPVTPPLGVSSSRRLLAELVIHIDPDAPGSHLPHDWEEVNNDIGSQTWTRYETNPRTGDACASVGAEPFWQNKDWLITPQLSVSSGDSLKFWYRVEDGAYPEEIEVRLSLSDSDIGSFTTLLWSSSPTNTDYLEKKINLSSYVGWDVYIAFVCNSLDKRRLYIDDVSGPGLSEGFETASTAISFSITSFLVDSTGYYYYVPVKVGGVLHVEQVACGDCNGDGNVTFADALYLKNYYYQTPPGSPAPIGQGDVNLDGRTTFADALYLKNYYYQTPPGSPPPCEPF